MKQKLLIVGLAALSLVACAHRAGFRLGEDAAAPGFLRLDLADPPPVGRTPAGQPILLGGFSGLRYLGPASGGRLRFLTLTDRGPNAAEEERGTETERPFLVPNYQPRLLELEADPVEHALRVTREIPLFAADGAPLTGLPPQRGPGFELAVDARGNALPPDPNGIDPEGVAVAKDGSYWVVKEYGPSLLHFSPYGKLLEVLRPGNGLPEVLRYRRLNRGFEGIAIDGDLAYLAMQSPLENPPAAAGRRPPKSRILRILAVNLTEKRTQAQYAYVVDSLRSDKIGDLAVESPGVLLVIERDGKTGPASIKNIYRTRPALATNLQLLPAKLVGPGGALELTPPDRLPRLGVKPLPKEFVLNLAALGLPVEKVEGIDPAGDALAFVTDNDFGVAGPLDRRTGRATFKEEPPSLYLLPKGLWKK